jgi:hypothetical protein
MLEKLLLKGLRFPNGLIPQSVSVVCARKASVNSLTCQLPLPIIIDDDDDEIYYARASGPEGSVTNVT